MAGASEDQIKVIVDRLDDLHRCLDEHIRDSTQWRQVTAARLDTMQSELSRNTEITESARGAYRALRLLGSMGVAVAAIAAAWQLLVKP